MKVSADDLWPLILDFIETYVGEDELESFKKFFKVDIKHKVSFIYLALLIHSALERSYCESRWIASIIS